MHHSYAIEGVDLAVLRDQASRRLRDKRNPPEETIIHHHRHGEHCNNRGCEHFTFDQLKEEDDG